MARGRSGATWCGLPSSAPASRSPRRSEGPGGLSAPAVMLLCVKNHVIRGSAHTEAFDIPVGRVAARQYGLIGRAQALEAGLSVAAIDWHVRSGEWERLHPSVYRLRGAPARWPQPLMAAILWGGPRAVVSHRSAAALWELDGIEPGVVELTTTGSRSDTPPGVILHRTRTLPRSSFGYLGAFRVTGVVRTLIDLGAVVDATAVEAAMESAIRR